MVGATAMVEGNGSKAVFEAEWADALRTGDPRWLSYPASRPSSQAELFEWVKARQIDAIIAQFGLQGGKVLEYACGAAGMGLYLANQGFHVVGLDISLNALRLADINYRKRSVHCDMFGLVAGDIFHLPFEDAQFDLVMSYGLLEHFTYDELVLLLSEANRLLRPGGLHIVDVIHGRMSIRTLANYANLFASAAKHTLQGQSAALPALYKAYIANYYENKLGPGDYEQLFYATGLAQVRAYTCRPFPLLALRGALDRMYTGALRQLLPAWQYYDQRRLPLLDGIGWMYLVYGRKPGGPERW